MVRKASFFDVEERLRELSMKGDDRERHAALVDFALLSLVNRLTQSRAAWRRAPWRRAARQGPQAQP